jgi:hypothetical protein
MGAAEMFHLPVLADPLRRLLLPRGHLITEGSVGKDKFLMDSKKNKTRFYHTKMKAVM